MRDHLRQFAPIWRVLEVFDTVRGYWELLPAPARWLVGFAIFKLIPSAVLTWLADPSNMVTAALLFGAALIVTWWLFSNVNIPYPMVKKETSSVATKDDVRMRISLRWADDVGKPIVTVENGKVVSMWAALRH